MEYPAQHRERGSVGELAAVRANVDSGVLLQQQSGSRKDAFEEVAIALTGLKLPAATVAVAERVRRPAEQPDPKPLIVVVVRDGVVRGRAEEAVEQWSWTAGWS